MADNTFEALKKELSGLKKDVLLASHTTFKIGGPAEYFLIAKNEKNVIKAISASKKLKLPLFIFGGGSNLLVSDKGINGLVVKIENNIKTFTFLTKNCIKAYAGVSLGDVVSFSIKKSLGGLEWAGGLPGTFGGAIRGNAGAFGGEIKDSIEEVRALDGDLKIVTLSNKECRFSYRSSIFKEKNWIVLSATLRLRKGEKKELELIARSRIDFRKERHPLEYPNAGSIFKNIDVKAFSPELQKKLAHVVKNDPFPIVPTAYLIFEAGLKGTRVGQAEISQKHTNFIINLGGATVKDVFGVIDIVKKKIKEAYGVELEMEVQYVK